MLGNLDVVLKSINDKGESISLSKFKFLVEEINFIGYKIRPNGIQAMIKTVTAICEFKKLSTVPLRSSCCRSWSRNKIKMFKKNISNKKVKK
jgi:hypothetical protein